MKIAIRHPLRNFGAGLLAFRRGMHHLRVRIRRVCHLGAHGSKGH